MVTKYLKMISLVDDTYDAYASFEEIQHFTNAIERFVSCYLMVCLSLLNLSSTKKSLRRCSGKEMEFSVLISDAAWMLLINYLPITWKFFIELFWIFSTKLRMIWESKEDPMPHIMWRRKYEYFSSLMLSFTISRIIYCYCIYINWNIA